MVSDVHRHSETEALECSQPRMAQVIHVARGHSPGQNVPGGRFPSPATEAPRHPGIIRAFPSLSPLIKEVSV